MCGLYVENSRLAVKTVCKFLYNHKVYLLVEDSQQLVAESQQLVKDSERLMVDIEEQVVDSEKSVADSEKQLTESMQLVKEAEPPTKKRITGKNDNIFYVLPSARTKPDYKQMQASQVERDAAMALGSKPDDVKSVLHYDTTSRNKIDGEWPSIILSFSDGRDFELSPIFLHTKTGSRSFNCLSNLITDCLLHVLGNINLFHYGKEQMPSWQMLSAKT